MECNFKSMCQLLGDRYGFFAIEIAPRLSLLIGNGDCMGMFSSVCRLWSHRASVPACARATYSASVVDKVVSVCFFDLYRMAPPLVMNVIPVVDFLSPPVGTRREFH